MASHFFISLNGDENMAEFVKRICGMNSANLSFRSL